MKLYLHLRIFTALSLMILCAALLSACGADSPLVYILGKDIPNFVDKTKDQKEPATLSGEYLLLYVEEPNIFSEPEKEDKGKKCVRLKNSATGQVEIILEGTGGSLDIEYGFILPETNTVLYTIRSNDTYLFVYDYKKHEVRLKTVVLERNKYRNGGIPFLNNMDLCAKNASVCTRIKYNHAYEHYIIDIKTGIRKQIDEKTYRTLIDEGRAGNPVRYESSRYGKKIKLFAVFPYHDYAWVNPKPKYNGICINDGKNNIRISADFNEDEYLLSRPVWVDDDKKVIIGRYLFDVEGNQKETKIADGRMLYAVPISK